MERIEWARGSASHSPDSLTLSRLTCSKQTFPNQGKVWVIDDSGVILSKHRTPNRERKGVAR